MSAPSPLPWTHLDGVLWTIGKNPRDEHPVPLRSAFVVSVVNGQGSLAAKARANAALIVRAVNAHETLAGALRCVKLFVAEERQVREDSFCLRNGGLPEDSTERALVADARELEALIDAALALVDALEAPERQIP